MHQTHHLRRISRVAGVLVAVFAVATGMRGQNLPATPPTALPGQLTPGAQQTAAPVPNPPLHAEVIYTRGLFQVRANNSSLNQILRSISHINGMKITGGVEDQRVFGNYGPAPLSTVLATLLDGTGANMLLLGGGAGTPAELVLTPRTGGPEPPGPNSPTYAMYDDATDRANRVAPAASRPPVAALPTPPPAVSTSASAKSVPPPASAPAKVLTPEMVMQELQQMQAQQDQKKKALDETIQREQMEQQKRLNAARPQNPPTPTPASSKPQ